MIQVRILTFAALRELFGKSDFKVSLPNGATLIQLLEMLFGDREDCLQFLKRVTFAVNYEQVTPDIFLREGDEVAILPPMAGG